MPAAGHPDPERRSGLLRRAVVFVAGLLCIAVGAALIVLPGPLTIPPIVLGLYIWSKEFAFAERLFDRAKVQFDQAWAASKRRPVHSALVTGGGLVGAGVVIWAVLRYDLIDKAKDVVGL